MVKKYLVLSDNDNADQRSFNWKLVPPFYKDEKPGDLPTNSKMSRFEDTRGHNVEWVLDGEAYFNLVLKQIEVLLANPKDAFFWMHGWYFQLLEHESVVRFVQDEDLPDSVKDVDNPRVWHYYHKGLPLKFSSTQELLADKLRELEKKGVDVRVIGWLSPMLMKSKRLNELSKGLVPSGLQYGGDLHRFELPKPDQVLDANISTLHSLLHLRKSYLQPEKVAFNILCHPLGGAHTKMVIAGNESSLVAFTGGIDAAESRNHKTWSDAAVRLEGTAALYAARFYRDIWNEIATTNTVSFELSIQKYVDGQLNAPMEIEHGIYDSHIRNKIDRELVAKPIDEARQLRSTYVQLFRTVPRKNYAIELNYRENLAKSAIEMLGGLLIYQGAQVSLSNFMRDVRQLPYLYTPPISFAPDGIFEYKVACFHAVAQATKYIFIMDQYLFNEELMTWINLRIRDQAKRGIDLKVIMCTLFLYPQDGQNPYKMGKRLEDAYKVITNGIPEERHKRHFIWADLRTHAKVVLIDDIYLSVGSANFARRSFYTDIEMGVSMLDETRIKAFRKDVFKWWLVPGADPVPDEWEKAVAIWFPAMQERYADTVDYSKLALRPSCHIDFPFAKVKDEEEISNRFNNPDSNLGY